MNSNAGFRGSRRDEDMLAGGPVSTQPHVTDDDEGDNTPCTEDEEFFQGRPDADDMEEAITKFLDGMEVQERSGFKDLHRFLGRLPLPVAKGDQSMLHSEALEGCFIPPGDEERLLKKEGEPWVTILPSQKLLPNKPHYFSGAQMIQPHRSEIVL